MEYVKPDDNFLSVVNFKILELTVNRHWYPMEAGMIGCTINRTSPALFPVTNSEG
jgi:hypothetical protein